ncbi:MAG: LCP family protein, partial [Oscillospiraceae bacterium]|nr:LCP family protein [Oscillospiraceae bacterium]
PALRSVGTEGPGAPETGAPLPEKGEAPAETDQPLPEGEALSTDRADGAYTFLLVGSDDGNGNTDALILGRLDSLGHQIDLVSIPRDTLINVPWEIRKINAVYWGARNAGGSGIAALKRQIGRLAGFEPDCCAVLDLDVFARAVDILGGVRFEVPMDMDYEDLGQDLKIHLKAGEQLLDGEQALGLCRYRSGYLTGDLGRIEMQQRFLGACVEQFLSLGSVPRAPELIALLSEELDTDLSAANMAFLLRQFLLCAPEDVRFHIAPTSPATIRGYSYAVLELDDWLELVDAYLDPYERSIGRGDVDVVYRSGGVYTGTAGLRDPGYYRPAERPAAGESPAALSGETAGDGQTLAQIVSEETEGPGETGGSGDAGQEPGGPGGDPSAPDPGGGDDGGSPAIVIVEP